MNVRLPELPSCISYDRSKGLLMDGIPCCQLADMFGTPSYCYSASAIRDSYRRFARALDRHLVGPWSIFYAYKGNASPALCKIIHNEGAGAEVMSMGELRQALALGVPPDSIIFNGIVKTDEELDYAIRSGIALIIIDSDTELDAIERIASANHAKVDVAFRVRPDITAGFHSHVSTGHRRTKFGFSKPALKDILRRAAASPSVCVRGIQTHIGSQVPDTREFLKAADVMFQIAVEVRDELGITVDLVDLGGGMGIQGADRSRVSFDFDALAEGVAERAAYYFREDLAPKVCFEPSRSIVGEAAILLGRVISLKDDVGKLFVGTDVGYNSFVRCMLYGAFHDLRNVKDPCPQEPRICEVVGPICESGDVLVSDHPFATPAIGDVIALLDVGAYGYAMASQYNSRPRPPEILIDEGTPYLIRHRETYSDMLGRYEIPPHLLAPVTHG
jgi:diaminopimelate decarboxylase